MNQYDQILEAFCGKDNFRPDLMTPFNYEGTENIYATDARVLVSIPKRLCEKEYETRSKPNVTAVLPKKTIRQPLSVLSLNMSLNKIPLVEKNVYKDCDECGGSGVVAWEYKHHEKEFNCPECDGDGDFRTNKTYTTRDTDSYIKLGENYFSGDILDSLSFAADKIGATEIYLLNESVSRKAHLYEVGEIEVLVMPMFERKETLIEP